MPRRKNKKTKVIGSSEMTRNDYEKLGRTLESIFEGGYIDHNRVYKINFVRGVFFGLGATVGAAVVLTSLVWLLSLFTELPFIGDLVETFRDSIDSS